MDQSRKKDLLTHLVKTNNWQQVLVFSKTKRGANRLAEALEKDGIQADAIHGNKSQPQRTRVLKRFKNNELQVLVATDIAARGIDIDELPHVVNFDLPHVPEDYVHRIGRTGPRGLDGRSSVAGQLRRPAADDRHRAPDDARSGSARGAGLRAGQPAAPETAPGRPAAAQTRDARPQQHQRPSQHNQRRGNGSNGGGYGGGKEGRSGPANGQRHQHAAPKQQSQQPRQQQSQPQQQQQPKQAEQARPAGIQYPRTLSRGLISEGR